MVEPHAFCGPEFTLELSEPRAVLEAELLLQLQTELYNLLTPAVRRRILGSTAAALPPPPDRILFVDAQRPTDSLQNSNDSDTEWILLVTDSRAAAEVFAIGLRNAFIALPQRMRLRNRYSGASARVSPMELLRRREALRSRMNFDEDLWGALDTALTPEWLRDFEAKEKQLQHPQQPEGPVRESQRHEQRIESVIRYCETAVRYVGVMDEDGHASPFLIAMGLFYRFGLTCRDAILHFARHPRRIVRAVALFVARYTVAPEELEPFFAPSLTDEVVIACTEDQRVTTSMRQLCEDLLLRDEVCEAWPPTYHALWLQRTVCPMIARVAAEWQRREEMRLSGYTAHEASGQNGGEEKNNGKATAAHGTGQGVGVFGFRHIGELLAFVSERERALIPQRVLAMLAPRHGERSRHNNNNDNDNDNDEDEDEDEDFLIKVRVEGDEGGGTAGSGDNERATTRAGATAAAGRKRRRNAAAVSARGTRALVVTEAYRVVMRLLGRTDPFDRRGEHYLSF